MARILDTGAGGMAPGGTWRRPTAGEAELAAISVDDGPSLKGRLLGPVAAGFVTLAVYGLLLTSIATRLVTPRHPA